MDKNLVFVEHCEQSSRKPFLFEVPEGVTLRKGDLVLCSTRHGEKSASCLTDSVWFTEEGARFVIEGAGATEPLRMVVGRISIEWFSDDTDDADDTGTEEEGDE